MLKKIFSLVFVLSLAVAPLASHAGFFDIFRTDRNYQNTAQLKSLTTNVVGLKRGDKSEVVLQVQQALTEAKLYAGDLSGLIGPKTESAIKAWQTSHGLAVTGILDATTVSSILGRAGESVGGNRDGIQCAGSAPQIMVTSPNGGESYQIGGQIEVTWETCNIPASELIYITIGTSASGQGHAFLTTGGTGTPNDGTETFTLSDTLPAGQYYVSAFRPAPNYLRDFSDNSFTLEAPMTCIPGGEQWIHLTSPNGGEVYNVGQNINVTWESCNIPANELLEINIHGTGTAIGFLVPNGTPNDGSQVVAQDRPVGTYYINIGTPLFPGQLNNSAMAIHDQSDNNFSIGGAGDCAGNDVHLEILPTTPSGVQNNMNDFPVLEFKVQNSSNCVVRLNGVRLAYMTTDTLPYFEDISLRDKATMTNIGPSQTLSLQSGDFINFSDDDNTPYLIPSGVTKEFVVVLEGYIPQTQGQLTYAAYANKNMIFGFPKLNPLDTDFVNPEQVFNIGLTGDIWGKVVKLPPSAF